MGTPGQHKGYGYIEYETRQSTDVSCNVDFEKEGA